MVRWIVNSSLQLRRLVIAAAVGVIVVGITAFGKTSVDVLPEFNPPMVEVQTEALGLSAEEVEQLITVPLEQDLLVGVPFLDEIESVSLPGLSSVVMTFEPGTDLLDARQVVQERLTQAVGIAGLPAVAKLPQMIQPLSSSSRVAMIRLSSNQLTPIEQSVLARWVIAPRLMSTPGVANVVAWGSRDRQLQVLVDPERLHADSTTLAQVIRTAGNALEVSPLSFLQASSPGTGGFIDTANQRLNIFHEQTINTPQELARVPLESSISDAARAGLPLALGDVADVVEGHQQLIGDAVCAGRDDCLLLVVEKFPGANTVEVTKGVERALSALRPGLADMAMDSSVYRPASFVESSFENLGWALLVGGLLLLLFLGALFWDWRTWLLGVAAIGVSITAAILVLQLRGTTVNFMVAAGLVVGLTAVIHDAITDVDGLARRLRRRDAQQPGVSAWTMIAEAATELRRPIFAAILVVAAATLPFFFMPAEGGAFLPPIALSYLLAVAASMLVALTVTPALAVMLLSAAPAGPADSPVANWLRRGYDRVAPRLVTRRGLALAVCAGLAAVGFAAVPLLDTSFRPALKERDVLVHLEARPGTSLPSMTETTSQIIRELGSLPGVANVGSHVGRAVMSDEIVDVNSGEVWLNLDAAADYDATVASVESMLESRPEVTTDVLTYSEERVTDVLERSSEDLVVRVYGEDADVLDAKASELRGMVAKVDGVTLANVERVPQEATLEVQVDLAKAQALGVKPGDVRRAAAILLGSITVGNLFDNQKVFDVVVWGTPEIRRSSTDIEQLLIDTPGGGQTQLKNVADVRMVRNPTVIRHESVASYLDVRAEVAGRDLGAVADEVDGLLDQVDFPLDHHAELLGGYAEQQDSQSRLVAAAVAAAIAILLLLQAAFGSWRLAVLAFGTLPLGLVGGLVAALLAGGRITLGSLAGLLAVFGVAVRGVIVLIRRYQRLERSEGVPFGPELVLRGTSDALAPTLMSALATALFFAPIAVAGDATGFDIVHPMVVVVLGGLVTATVVNLLVVPVLYLRYGYFARSDSWMEDLFAADPDKTAARSGAPSRVMQRVRAVAPVVAVVIPALLLSSCGGSVAAEAYVIEHEPAKAVPIAGSDRIRVVLEKQAAARLEVQTTLVRETPDGLVVPSKALFVDPDGVWWVFTNPEPLAYVRREVGLDRQVGRQAFLSSGLRLGSEVVTVGGAELWGIEEDIGH